ncbi:hypothetical protein DE146DRAFT_721709 [Phaeosphaeria sp. MPI-PUGE-AT-0046c]|nr:hypothetical protein DE146DRAFT_721709 [Phaeosphaeria sp. MPI-PUGE-AT-0046c]
MPITFGSVGDIISVCLLVKDLVDALDKARGSKAEYRSLIRELWILDRSLLEIDLLARTHGGGATPELEALCETARKAVIRCRELQHESNLDKQDGKLQSINERLEDTNRLIASGNSVTAKLADALRLDWLRQLGTELKGYMRRIITMNIATYHAVLSIQSALPGRLERGLIEEPFILEDAIGRIAPVHLQFVTSWDAFHAVLEIRFREMQGFKKVMQKQYGLQDKASKRDIEASRPWQRAFLPGQRIEMSFIFDAQGNEGSEVAVTCPGCQTPSTNPVDAEIQCENCKMWFRRITIVQDVEPPPQAAVPSPWRSRSEFGKPGFVGMVAGPVRPGKRRVAPSDVDGEDDLREFKRGNSPESYVTEMEMDRVTPARESYSDPKSFPELVPHFISTPLVDIDNDWDEKLIDNHLYTSAPFSEAYPRIFYHFDPHYLTMPRVQVAREALPVTVLSRVEKASWDDTTWSRAHQPNDFIWPLCSMSIYVSTKKLLGVDDLDWRLIASTEGTHGTPFRLPNTDTVFYGSAIGRWIFDWTCRFYDKPFLVRKALHLWADIFYMEKTLFSLVNSRFGWGTDKIWGFSEEADLNFSHFVVCCRLFWWQLLQSMTAIRLQNEQDFHGIQSPNVEAYAKEFLKSFFSPTASGLGGSHTTATKLLHHCETYYDAGINEIEKREEKIAKRKTQ